jgi:hypothetical protein
VGIRDFQGCVVDESDTVEVVKRAAPKGEVLESVKMKDDLT